MQCRALVAQLGRRSSELEAAGTHVIVILGNNVERARKYAQDLKLPFPVLADPDREIYHRYGLHKAMILIQRTASLVIDKNGAVRYLKQTTNPMVWLAEIDELCQAALNIQ